MFGKKKPKKIHLEKMFKKKDRVKEVISFFRIIGFLLLSLVIFMILWQFNIWNKMSLIDKLFFIAAAIVVSILLGVKKEKVITYSP